MDKKRFYFYAVVIVIVFLLSGFIYAEEAPKKININIASLEELDTLPGIGPVLGQRIIDYRSKHPFKKIEEIKKVEGIKEGRYKKLKDRIVVK